MHPFFCLQFQFSGLKNESLDNALDTQFGVDVITLVLPFSGIMRLKRQTNQLLAGLSAEYVSIYTFGFL